MKKKNLLLIRKNSRGRMVIGKSSKKILLGQRIPRDYFITRGKGESDIAVHAGSYHLALRDAGIEMFNIMTYSSIMPAEAREVEKPENFTHGSVLESIMAVADSPRGSRATAGIIYGWLYDYETGTRYGGLVCEYHGEESEQEAGESLHASLNELYTNGYSERYSLKDIRLITNSFVPEKKFGTALVAICFTNHLYPVIK